MNKKNLLFLLFLVCSGFLFSQNALERIKESGYLDMGTLDHPSSPFVVQEEGQWKGFEIVRARKMAALLQAELRTHQFQNMEDAEKALLSGEIDIFFHKHFKTLQKGMRNFLTEPIAQLNMVLLINRRAFSQLKLPPEAKNRFLEGDFAVTTLEEEHYISSFKKEYPENTLSTVPSDGQLWSLLTQGEIIGAYMDEAQAGQYFEQNPSAGITLKYIPLDTEQQIVGLISWKEDFFLDWVNIAIDNWVKPENLKELEQVLQGE